MEYLPEKIMIRRVLLAKFCECTYKRPGLLAVSVHPYLITFFHYAPLVDRK